MSSRSRREWRIILWINLAAALVSAWFGYRVTPTGDPPLYSALIGVMTSLMIATPILLLEAKGQRTLVRRLRRLPLAVYFTVKLVFYFVVIIGGLVMARVLFSRHGFHLDGTFSRSIMFAITMAVVGNVIFDMGGLLARGRSECQLLAGAADCRRQLAGSSSVPRMPLGRKMMNTTSRTP